MKVLAASPSGTRFSNFKIAANCQGVQQLWIKEQWLAERKGSCYTVSLHLLTTVNGKKVTQNKEAKERERERERIGGQFFSVCKTSVSGTEARKQRLRTMQWTKHLSQREQHHMPNTAMVYIQQWFTQDLGMVYSNIHSNSFKRMSWCLLIFSCKKYRFILFSLFSITRN